MQDKLNIESWCLVNVSPYLSQNVRIVRQNACLVSCASYLISPRPMQLRNWYLRLQIYYFKKVSYGPMKLENCSCRVDRGYTLFGLIYLHCSVNTQPPIVHYAELAWYYSGTEFPHGIKVESLINKGRPTTEGLQIYNFALCREIPKVVSPIHTSKSYSAGKMSCTAI